MSIKDLLGIVERLRARAQLFRQSPKGDEATVGRCLDEVADAIEETLDQPASYDDDDPL